MDGMVSTATCVATIPGILAEKPTPHHHVFSLLPTYGTDTPVSALGCSLLRLPTTYLRVGSYAATPQTLFFSSSHPLFYSFLSLCPLCFYLCDLCVTVPLSFPCEPRSLRASKVSSRPQPRAFCPTHPLSSRPQQRRLLPLRSGGIVAQSLDLERPLLPSELCVGVYPGPLGASPSLFSFSLYSRPRLYRPLPTLRFLCGPSVLSVLSISLFLFFPPLQTSASSAPPFTPTRSGRCLFLSFLKTKN